MKRTWVVVVGEGVGHEYCDMIGESRFFGPYTKDVAEKLSTKICDFFAGVNWDGGEGMEAQRMCLESMSPSKLLAEFKSLFAEEDDV